MTIKATSPLFEYTATSSYDSMQKAAKAMCKHKSAQGNIGLEFSMFASDKGCPMKGDWIVKHPDIWSDEPVFESISNAQDELEEMEQYLEEQLKEYKARVYVAQTEIAQEVLR